MEAPVREMSLRIIRFATDLGGLFLTAFKACFSHRASSKAAALAFYTLISLAPLLVLLMALAGLLFGDRFAQGDLFAPLKGLLGPAGAKVVQNMVVDSRVSGAGPWASGIAVVLLGLGATSVFAELKDSLDEIWKVQVPVPSGLLALIRSRLLSFGLILALSFLLLSGLVVNGILGLLERVWGSGPGIIGGLSSLFTFGVIACLFAVIYKMLPEVTLPWRDVVIGSLCTAALFSLGRFAIGAYLGGGRVSSSFGAAGSVAALLIWVYYSAQIFFLGAEFTRVYALTFGSLKAGLPDPNARAGRMGL